MSVPETQLPANTELGPGSPETRQTVHDGSLSPQRVLKGSGATRLSIISSESASLLSAHRNYGTAQSTAHTHPASHELPEESELDSSPPTWREKLQSVWEGNRGLLLVLIAQIFNTVMNTATRILEIEGNDGKGYHPFQVLFARMSITLVFSGLYMWWKKVDQAPLGPKNMRWLLLIRGFGGFFGVFGMYYSLLYLPLSDATVLSFLSPTITCIACYIFLREPFTRTQQIAGAISLIGVVMVARPTTLFSSPSAEPPPASGDPSGTPSTLLAHALAKISSSSSSDPYQDTDPAHRLLAIFFALLGVCGASCAYTTLRIIGPSTHPLVSVTYFSGACCLISVLSFLPLPPPFPSVPFALPSAPLDWALLILLGVAGFLMQFLLSMGLQGTASKKTSSAAGAAPPPKRSSKGNAATAMVYTSMVFAVISDAVVFGTLPDAWGWGGVAAIVGSALVVATGGHFFGRKATEDEPKDEVAKKDEEVGLLSDEVDGHGGQRQMAREEQAVTGLH
ncbi:EamA-like transporter family-domain-containing protein [Phyllosticta citriasiana]|uniref:EamA-like transporter family-domain-containing protein n=1 Tax=Phyllosticta citriasiana TaxID=595635 RepID=UPI0030FD3017